MKQINLIVVLLFIVTVSFAQNNKPQRFEIPIRSGGDPVSYLPCGIQGVLVYYPTISESAKDSINWSFMFLDHNLNKEWQQLMPLHEDVTFLKGIYRNNVVYLLFHDTKRSEKGNIFVFMVYPDIQLITEHRGSIPDKAEVIDFDIIEEKAIVGYNIRKGNPGLHVFSLSNAEQKTIDVTANNESLLLDICADTASKQIFTIHKEQDNKGNDLFISIFDKSFNPLFQVKVLNMQEKRIISSAQFMPTGTGRGIVFGAYGTSNQNNRKQYDYFNDYYNYYYFHNYNYYLRNHDRYDNNQDNTPESDGFYTVELAPEATPTASYYSFIDFSNTIRYMTEMDAVRIKNKADKRNKSSELSARDERNLSLRYRLLLHDVVWQNNAFILAAEAYYPEYHSTTQMMYDIYGRPIPSTYSVFDGFRYTNSFIAAFDSTGKMIWNNGVEMRDILTKYINRKLGMLPDKTETVVFYNANKKLSYKVIQKENVIENTASTQVDLLRGTDEIIDEYLGSVQSWYGNNVIVSGYAEIKNNYISQGRRTVFYLNKLSYE
jgi:hypothetical protein